MEITLVTHDVTAPQRFRDHVEEKSGLALSLAERAHTFQVKLSRENSSRQGPSETIVEITIIGKGPVIRAEARSTDLFAAFDQALDHLVRRLRRAKEKRHPNRGGHRAKSMGEVSAEGFADIDITPASVELIRTVETGTIPVVGEDDQVEGEPQEPLMIRRKLFPAQVMTASEAVDHMELVGHDFYLFIDQDSSRASVVYRRRGWQYGVIALEEH